MARMKETYKTEIAPALMKKFGYKSVMQIPKLEKVVVNVGCGRAMRAPTGLTIRRYIRVNTYPPYDINGQPIRHPVNSHP